MDERLLEYRRRKAARQDSSQETKSRPTQPAPHDVNKLTPGTTAAKSALKDANDSSDEERKFRETMQKQKEALGIRDEGEELSFWDKHIEKILKFLLWGCLQGFFIQLGFGAVYFVVSLSYVMYASMRSGSGRPGLSAYSVFNKDCQRIHGTFTAEQFEDQLRHGTTSSS